MKITLIILFVLIAAFFILFFTLGVMSKSGEAPGLLKGGLSKCPAKPNCVCSEHNDDTDHFIDPINMPEDLTVDSLPILKNVIEDMGGIIQTERDHYLAATFTSAIFRFVDDLEIRIDSAQKVIHIRSASRVGHSDRGVNMKRTERLKQLYQQRISQADQPVVAP